MLLSPAHIIEIEAITEILERTELQEVLNKFGTPVVYRLNETRARVEALIKSGFGIADTAHMVFAEQMKAPFISCDEKLIKKCQKHKFSIWVGNPLSFCEKEGLK